MSGDTPLTQVLRTGLSWLDMEQPLGAIQTHHGIHGGAHWGGRISVEICPRGGAAGSHPIIVFDVRDWYWARGVVANPFTRNEIVRLDMAVASAARPVDAWNGEGCISYSVAVDHGVHPTLDGALWTNARKCPDHGMILCGWEPPTGANCPWYRNGNRLMRYPAGWRG